MQELWINDQDDFNDLKAEIRGQEFKVVKCGSDEDGNEIVEFGEYRIHIPNKFQLDIKGKDPSKSGYDKLIFGKDSTENITNISIKDGVAHIYRKDAEPLRVPYNKWAVGSTWADGCHKLKGHQYYKYMKDITEDEYERLRQSWNPRVWMPRTPEEGFMLKHGYTQYKGMKVSDVSILSFDIEATGLDPKDPNAEVLLISNTYRDRTGKITKRLFDIHDYSSAASLVEDWDLWVQEIDPDILLGHNILSYDIPYICNSSCLKLTGRDGSGIKFDDKVWKFRKDGSQQIEYHNAYIHGRDIIDTMFLSIKYDIGRDFPSYSLKMIEKHLGLVNDDRIEWDFLKYPTRDYQNWPEGKWEEFRQYCRDDGDSPLKMFDIMIPAFFYLTQSVPKTLQQIINEASGSQLDSLMIRSYLQDGYSIPRTSQKEEFQGAISFGIPGKYENVLSVDFEALYPSIIKQYKIFDKKKDPNGNLLKITEYFTKVRQEYKKMFKETGNEMYNGMQLAAKIVANSIYGFMGAGFLLFNSPKSAARVTELGRELLNKICLTCTEIDIFEWKRKIEK